MYRDVFGTRPRRSFCHTRNLIPRSRPMRTALRRSVLASTCAALALAAAVSLLAQPSRVAVPRLTAPEAFFGHPIGADYVLPNYTKFTEYVRLLDKESDRMVVQSIGRTAEGRDAVDGHHQRAGELRQARSLPRDRAPPRPCRRADGRHRTRARQGRQGRHLDRRRPARHRGARRAAAARDHLAVREQDRRRDDAHPARHHHPGRPRQSRRHGAGLRLVHAQAGRRPSAAPGRLRGSTRSTSATTTTATSMR